MSWKQLAGKGTWLGTATAAVVLLAALGVSSLLLLRGIVPERAMGPLVWGSSVLACFCRRTYGPYGRAVWIRCLGRWQYPPVYMVQCGSRR